MTLVKIVDGKLFDAGYDFAHHLRIIRGIKCGRIKLIEELAAGHGRDVGSNYVRCCLSTYGGYLKLASETFSKRSTPWRSFIPRPQKFRGSLALVLPCLVPSGKGG